MTFILNTLHRDFSLIASDRKGTTKGPVTLEMNGRTINIVTEGTVTIEGMKKIHLSRPGNVAVGFAGNASEHRYVDKIDQADSHKTALSIIRSHMEDFLSHDHKHLLEVLSFTNNAGIATYHETETDTFYSNSFSFSPIHNSTRLHSGDTGCLIHVGSGSEIFECAVGSEEINRFVESLRSPDDVPSYVQWMREACKKMSAKGKGTSEEMVLFVGTKQNPSFVQFQQ